MTVKPKAFADAEKEPKDVAPEHDSACEERSCDQAQMIPKALLPIPLAEPDATLLAKQLMATVPLPPGTDHESGLKDLHAALALYAAIEPKDAFESALARLAVALLNAGMDSAGRLIKAGDVLPIREAHSKLLAQSSIALVRLLEAMDRHRRLQLPRRTIHQVAVGR